LITILLKLNKANNYITRFIPDTKSDMPTRQDNIEITPDYWLGDFYQNDGWKRLTLFHKVAISNVGSNNTPIVQVDIVKHPGNEYFNSHSEIKFTIRTDLKRQGHEVQIDKNKKISGILMRLLIRQFLIK